MSAHYTATSSADGRELWKHAKPDDHFPVVIATEYHKHPELYAAMAAVLAPSDELVHALAQKFMDDRFGDEQWQWGGELWDFCLSDVRTLLTALRDHATGGGDDA